MQMTYFGSNFQWMLSQMEDCLKNINGDILAINTEKSLKL